MFGTVIAHSLFDVGTATSDCEKLEIYYNTWDCFILIVVLTGLATFKVAAIHYLTQENAAAVSKRRSALCLCVRPVHPVSYMAVIDDMGPYI